MPCDFYRVAGEPRTEPYGGGHMNPLGADLLCAAVLRYAYSDLLDALFASAAIANRERSYNCHIYYKRINKTGKGRYCVTRGGKADADDDIRKMEIWFRSERCRQFCHTVQGEWFIDQAHRQIERWQKDLIPEWIARPSYDQGDKNFNRWKRNEKRWRAERDQWRADHHLPEIK